MKIALSILCSFTLAFAGCHKKFEDLCEIRQDIAEIQQSFRIVQDLVRDCKESHDTSCWTDIEQHIENGLNVVDNTMTSADVKCSQ